MKKLLPILLLALLFLHGCAEPQESDLVGTGTGGEIVRYGDYVPQEDTLIGTVVKEWRMFSILFLLISIGLIALAYPVSAALDLKDLRAWAEVEMGEAYSTALIVMLVIGVLVFVELVTHGITASSIPWVDCDGDTFCPVVVAKTYLQKYLDKTMPLYYDLLAESVRYGKLATTSFIAGTNYMYLGYLSITMKPMPFFLIKATSATQELQFLMGMRDALFFQQFLLNHVSSTLAPMALLLGIIFRSFFITRKLGGLLMAFGIGFMLVFPASYALAMYTLDTTIHGTSVSGGDVSNEHCTANCRKMPPVAYVPNEEEGYTRADIEGMFPITDLFPQNPGESNEDYEARLEDLQDEYFELISSFVKGEECKLVEVQIAPGVTELVEDCTPIEYWDTSGGDRIYTCGYYDDLCPVLCRTLPYPNEVMECASRKTEYFCRDQMPEQCFLIRMVDMDDTALQGLEPVDISECPEECRPLIGLKKEGCDVGYGFELVEGMKAEDIEDLMEDDGYADKPEVETNHYKKKRGDYVSHRGPGSGAEGYLRALGFEDVKINTTVIWDEGCPSDCRWISTTGRMGIGCDTLCKMDSQYFPDDPQAIWDEAHAATTLEGQIEAAEKSCVMIIPEHVFNSQDCTSCSYLLDPGFASYPPVHQSCQKLCGSPKSATGDSDLSSELAEMDSVTSITFPALILPMLNLVITLIAIRTLSPILGGDIDIPGMMRMIQ